MRCDIRRWTNGAPPPAAAVVVAILAVCAGACSGAPADAITHVLGDAGSHRANVSIATRGDRVVVVFGAQPVNGAASVMAAASDDGGRTFAAPVRVDDAAAEPRVSGEVPPQIVFLGDERVAAAWPARRGGASEIRFAVSSDGGRTFSASRLAHAEGVPNLRGWVSAAGDAAGRLHLAWLDGRNAAPAATTGAGGGRHGSHGGPSPRQDLYRAVVEADGSVAERGVEADVCFCCKTSIAAAPGGVNVVWRHIFPGSLRDIAIAPLDGDAAPTRVSADNWKLDACPDDGPAIAVDAAGTRHVVWPTMATGADGDKAVFYAASRDGTTFTPRDRLSLREDGAASHPRIAVAPDGMVAAVWDERFAGTVKARMREWHPGSTWTPAVTLGDGGATPALYPAVAATGDAWLVGWTSGTQPQTEVVVQRIPFKYRH